MINRRRSPRGFAGNLLYSTFGNPMKTERVDSSKVDLDWEDGHVFPQKPYPDVAFLYRRMNEVTLGALATDKGDKILDVGCGRATDAITLAGEGGRCSGLEPSRKMLELALESIIRENSGLNLVQGTGEYLPFGPASFDRVICKGALDHFPSPGKAIEEMARVLKPGGRVIIAVTNFESLGFKLGRQLFKLIGIFSREKAKYRDVLLVPTDHTLEFDYPVLKKLVEPYLAIEQSTGVSLLFGVPFWGALLDRLPGRVSLAILNTLERLACRFPAMSNVIVLKCRPR
ncbi:MAG: methyltransferase domain-containing protein [Dehalococcoidales bacterium]|nr:MAG: methyltransferase domain-containing protein [Dehalococcoidales bacterium]